MQQFVDWVAGHSFSIIGGTILFVGILAAVVYASKQSQKDNQKALENKDPREGE
ncbi:MAG: hypothetical protein H6839_08065 [Planctomycetes bacterium]|nr:hypothetical protein [Planctomycetota bacterium]